MASREMQRLLKTQKTLLSKLTRAETEANGLEDAPLDPIMIKIQLDNLNDLKIDVKDWENDVLGICTDAEFPTYEGHVSGMIRRMNEVKAMFLRKLQPEGPNGEPRQPGGNAHLGPGIKLPKLDLPKFDGNLHDWMSFRDRFIAAVHNSNMANCDKLSYLQASLTGKAADTLKAMQITNDNYKEAWEMLEKRFQNRREIGKAHLDKFMNLPAVSYESADAMRQIVDVGNETIRSLGTLDLELNPLASFILCHALSKKIDPETMKQWELSFQDDSFPKIDEFVNFLDRRSRALAAAEANQPGFSKPKYKSTHVGVVRSSCPICNEQHGVYKCPKFFEMNVEERRTVVRDHGLCFKCLNPGHASKDCHWRPCRKCNGMHHVLVHYDEAPKIDAPATSQPHQDPASYHLSSVAVPNTLLATAVVLARNSKGQQQPVRALLDGGSQLNLITEGCLQRLGLPRRKLKTTIGGLGGEERGRKTESNGIAEIVINSRLNSNLQYSLTVLSLPTVTSPQPNFPVDPTNCLHFKDLPLADPNYYREGHVDLLLGADIFTEILRNGIRRGPEGAPKAYNTTLGWAVSGSIMNRKPMPPVSLHTCCQLETIVRQLWETESVPETKVLSLEEKKCVEHYNKTHCRNSNGRYVVRLPFKDDGKTLGESRQIALRRLLQVERRLSKDPKHLDKYNEVLAEYLSLGHMEKVPANELNKKTDAVFYMPHHGVIKECSTTTKLRVVFDCSAKTSTGVSLNDTLMIGPTIQEDLFSILVRARRHQIMFSADCEKMYRQILIHPKDADYQRILWRRTPGGQIEDYRLLTVTFGVASAPFQAIKTLHQIADDNADECPLAAEIIKHDFYVDDLVSGCDSQEVALVLQKQLIDVLARGGFPLRKWTSSDPALLESLPAEMRETSLPLDFNPDATIKTLGLKWQPALDQFVFAVKLPPSSQVTKRSMLSELAKLFDPLGLMSPVTIRGKILFQSLWYLPIHWDDEVDEEISASWQRYLSDLAKISEIAISRCISLPSPVKFELHCFSDASTKAFAGAVYLKSMDATGRIKVKLVAAKTRVAPKKPISLPRLELNGAVLVTRLAVAVKAALKLPEVKMQAYTDSSIVMAWLSASANRWCTFVANRVSEIQDAIPGTSWQHVPGGENPADCASRGIPTDNLIGHNLWWSGPSWLSSGDIVPEHAMDHVDSELLEERKQVPFVGASFTEEPLLSKYSSFTILIRITAVCFRFVNNCRSSKKGVRGPNHKTGFITTKELLDAEYQWIKIVQANYFTEELTAVKNNTKIKSKPIRMLAPVMDDKGILRVGGRLHYAKISEDRKHPILLPKTSAFTSLLIQTEHLRNLHAGPLLLMSVMQRKYWVIGARDIVGKITRKCARCLRFNVTTAQQLMASLPAARVTPSPPFTIVGVDYTGPVLIRAFNNNSKFRFKAYIAIFTCFSTKSVHLELVNGLTTRACIDTIRRFISRRGKPNKFYSDHGRSFIGAHKELNEFIKMIRTKSFDDQVGSELTNLGIEWQHNPPYTPHWGGLWEAGIKCLKYHLRRILGTNVLNLLSLLRV